MKKKKLIEIDGFLYAYPKNRAEFEQCLNNVSRRAWAALDMRVQQEVKKAKASYESLPEHRRLQIAETIIRAVNAQSDVLVGLARIVSPQTF